MVITCHPFFSLLLHGIFFNDNVIISYYVVCRSGVSRPAM